MTARPAYAEGDALPELTVPVTRDLVVATAIASRDYQDVHHDPAAAQASGTDDVFMNILTSNAMVERFVRGWAGPEARLRALRIRLGVPNCAGDVLTLRGRVTEAADDHAVVEVVGENARGVHVSGSATVAWPDRGTEA